MNRPNIDSIKSVLDGYNAAELKHLVKHLIKYIESRGQVRTEEEIRERLKQARVEAAHLHSYEYTLEYRAALTWALEDSDPEPESDIVERLKADMGKDPYLLRNVLLRAAVKEIEWVRKSAMYVFPTMKAATDFSNNRLKPLRGMNKRDPKPIEKMTGEGPIPDKFNEIIDQLEEHRKEYGQVTSLMKGSRLIKRFQTCPSNAQLADRCNTITDRLNEMTKTQGER